MVDVNNELSSAADDIARGARAPEALGSVPDPDAADPGARAPEEAEVGSAGSPSRREFLRAIRMAQSIERVHEPYLIEKGFVIRTSRGRVATVKGLAHIARMRASRAG